jgi:hypothetical protein
LTPDAYALAQLVNCHRKAKSERPRERIATPIPQSPSSIMAQVAGSGMAPAVPSMVTTTVSEGATNV